MSYPPYRNQSEGLYERDAERRRERRDEERQPRYRELAPEPERFRRDHTASFENEDRAFGYGQNEGQPSRRHGAARSELAERSERRGAFAGRGPKNYRRSDQRIHEEVCDRLTSDPQVDASEIQVSVKDGEITLEGSVAERHMKRLAEDCADSVAGVSQVHNRLRIDEADAQRSQGIQGQGSSSPSRQSSGRTA